MRLMRCKYFVCTVLDHETYSNEISSSVLSDSNEIIPSNEIISKPKPKIFKRDYFKPKPKIFRLNHNISNPNHFVLF